MTNFQKALLDYGHLTVRTYKDERWTVEFYSGKQLKLFVDRIDGELDETIYKVRGLGLIDLYLN